MTDATKLDRSASGLPFPPATSRESLTVAQLADLYVAAYKGRDSSRLHYLSDWVERLGDVRVVDLDADRIADALDAWYTTPARRYLDRDKVMGAARWKTLGFRRPATYDRMRSRRCSSSPSANAIRRAAGPTPCSKSNRSAKTTPAHGS